MVVVPALMGERYLPLTETTVGSLETMVIVPALIKAVTLPAGSRVRETSRLASPTCHSAFKASLLEIATVEIAGLLEEDELDELDELDEEELLAGALDELLELLSGALELEEAVVPPQAASPIAERANRLATRRTDFFM